VKPIYFKREIKVFFFFIYLFFVVVVVERMKCAQYQWPSINLSMTAFILQVGLRDRHTIGLYGLAVNDSP
jgi:hypothetical protein